MLKNICLVFMIINVCYSSQIGLENFNNVIKDKNFQFSFKNCGPSNDPLQVYDLSLKPDPLKLPGNVTIFANFSSKIEVDAPLTLALKIIKIVGKIKITVPCIDNFGSCTYNDVCAKLPTQCPDIFQKLNITCHCPFNSGLYLIPNLQFILPSVPIPSGNYEVIINLQTKQGHLGCLDLMVNFG